MNYTVLNVWLILCTGSSSERSQLRCHNAGKLSLRLLILRKQMEMRNSFSVSPLRPTLLYPLGVRPMFCKFQTDENLALSPVTSQKLSRLNSVSE